jgi:signal recognition particle receptor subunit beta
MREVLIIYHGVGMAGKTTNLESLKNIFQQYVIDRFHTQTVENRTVFLDTLLLGIKVKNSDIKLKVRIMSTPGQERFSILRPWIINNADGFVFVYDPTVNIKYNLEAFKEIQESVKPKVVQINKTDLADRSSIENAKKIFNKFPTVEAVANNGVGVKETLQIVLKEILR